MPYPVVTENKFIPITHVANEPHVSLKWSDDAEITVTLRDVNGKASYIPSSLQMGSDVTHVVTPSWNALKAEDVRKLVFKRAGETIVLSWYVIAHDDPAKREIVAGKIHVPYPEAPDTTSQDMYIQFLSNEELQTPLAVNTAESISKPVIGTLYEDKFWRVTAERLAHTGAFSPESFVFRLTGYSVNDPVLRWESGDLSPTQVQDNLSALLNLMWYVVETSTYDREVWNAIARDVDGFDANHYYTHNFIYSQYVHAPQLVVLPLEVTLSVEESETFALSSYFTTSRKNPNDALTFAYRETDRSRPVVTVAMDDAGRVTLTGKAAGECAVYLQATNNVYGDGGLTAEMVGKVTVTA